MNNCDEWWLTSEVGKDKQLLIVIVDYWFYFSFYKTVNNVDWDTYYH